MSNSAATVQVRNPPSRVARAVSLLRVGSKNKNDVPNDG